jgi:hypothetical protein
VAVGKFNGLLGDNNAFAHDFRTQFLILGLNFNAAGCGRMAGVKS